MAIEKRRPNIGQVLLTGDRGRKWKWLGHTLVIRNEDCFVKQAYFNEHQTDTEIDGDYRTPREEISRKK